MKRTKASAPFVRIFSLLLCCIIFLASCSNNGKGTGKNGKDSSQSTGEKAQESQEITKELSDASNEVCDCISDLESDLSSDFKAMIVRAGNSDNPKAALNEEAQKITDSVEQQKLTAEIETMKNSSVFTCLENVVKNHPNLKNRSNNGQKRMSEAVEQNCSEFAAALVKIGR